MCDREIPERRSYEKINRDFIAFSPKVKLKLPLIRIHYGPHECNGFIKHKPQKLYGLIACLRKLQYDIEVIPSSHLNVLKFVILGYEVYRINIKFLQFNIDCSYDTICALILEKIEEATSRLYSNNNIAKNVELWKQDLEEDLSITSMAESDDDLSSMF